MRQQSRHPQRHRSVSHARVLLRPLALLLKIGPLKRVRFDVASHSRIIKPLLTVGAGLMIVKAVLVHVAIILTIVKGGPALFPPRNPMAYLMMAPVSVLAMVKLGLLRRHMHGRKTQPAHAMAYGIRGASRGLAPVGGRDLRRVRARVVQSSTVEGR
jgi:hypothetical protein